MEHYIWRRLMTLTIVIIHLCNMAPRIAEASIFDDIGDTLTRVSGLRGVIRSLSSGASEGVREQLDRFIDEKVDPLVSRIDEVVQKRIDQAKDAALAAIRQLQESMDEVIDRAAHHAEQLTKEFFDRLDTTLNNTLARLETLLDDTLCKIMPDGSIYINVGPFGGGAEIKVRYPYRTECYRHYLGAQGDPPTATFVRYEYFAGELCENEIKLNNIDPRSRFSIRDTIAGYDKLSEMANTARCAAPTPTAKAEMVEKLLLYQRRAEFLRSVSGTR